jgi:hypothetical protein
VPTFLYQMRDDVFTHAGDVRAMFDNIPVAEKKLHWIVLTWFATYLS